MKTEDIIKKLKKEYKEVYIWTDKPNKFYPNHKHLDETKIIILEGNIIIKKDNKKYNLEINDSITINKNETHDAKIGVGGCKYIVAEKRREK